MYKTKNFQNFAKILRTSMEKLFLSYFDHDRKYFNSRIVVDDSYERDSQHCKLSNFGQPGFAQLMVVKPEIKL